jgi:hypothetical protein
MTDLQIPRDGGSLKPLPDCDLARLNNEELELLGRLLLKAAGEFDGDVIPQFRIERVFVDPAEPIADAN